jgi:hypothetical protein
MPIGGALAGLGSLGSGLLGFFGANSAANAQAQAAAQALAFQKYVFGVNQGNLNPFIQTGQQADASLAALYGLNGSGTPNYSAFLNSPDYQFAFGQGLNATTNLLSAKGDLASGGGLAALTNFGQGLASQQFGNYYNRLLSLSQLGANAASALAGSNVQSSGQIGNTQQAIGQAQAAGIVGGTNALTGAIGGGINNYLLYNALGRSSNPSSFGSGSIINSSGDLVDLGTGDVLPG